VSPRQPRMLGSFRISAADDGLLTALKVSGENLHIGAGFPLSALAPASLAVADNWIGCLAGPTTPIEAEWSTDTSVATSWDMGCDLPEPGVLDAATADLAAGRLVGSKNFTLGLGEESVADGDDSTEFSSVYAERECVLKRLIIESDDAAPQPGECYVTTFNIAGEDMLASSGSIDVLALSSAASDERGLRLNTPINTRDQLKLVIHNASGATVKFQVGFFID
jgi:hypothetical protein